ncbi:hypothetical protein IRJ41_023831 [Triplophysa rosa]|uniref:Uncharacterized protein n=1 Tax=Triplophysa rosa TaxID=992332 RepID=A0A9W7TMX5_TRIRA|nr:hypothetical protein IRJ41_023831 [Triplophysa rosa]
MLTMSPRTSCLQRSTVLETFCFRAFSLLQRFVLHRYRLHFYFIFCPADALGRKVSCEQIYKYEEIPGFYPEPLAGSHRPSLLHNRGY